MRGGLLLTTLAINLAAAQQVCNDTDKVFSMPITSVSLPNGAMTRSIPITVGSPPQTLAFLPFSNNNTYVYHPDSTCDFNASYAACETRHGGYFAFNKSTTYTSLASAPLTEEFPTRASTFWAQDKFNLGSLALQNYTFGISKYGGNDVQLYQSNRLGLGPNSTLLAQLKAQNIILSKSWSMFWGRTPDPTGLDGEDGLLHLGGYDASKIIPGSKNITRSLDYNACPEWGMPMTVTDMTLNFPNGTNTSFLEAAGFAQYAYCIFPGMSGGAFYMDNFHVFPAFENLTQTANYGPGLGFNMWDLTYDTGVNKDYQGGVSLDIDYQKDFAVYDHDLLIHPGTYINNDGVFIRNNSKTELLLGVPASFYNTTKDPVTSPVEAAGRFFLSTVMLYVNYDAGTYTIWPAKFSGPARPVSISAYDTACSSPLPQSSGSTLTGGAIAGAVIGVVAALAVLVALLAFLATRSRRKGRAAAVYNKSETSMPPMQDKFASRHQLHAHQEPVELATRENADHAELETVEPAHELSAAWHHR